MIRRAILVAAASLALMAGAGRAPAAGLGCDRECLRGFVSGYLAALVKHRPGDLKLAKGVRFTENGEAVKPGEGLWKDASAIRPYRLDILDPQGGTAGALVVVDEGGQPALLALRLKIKDRRIVEVETQVTRSQKEGAIFAPDALTAVDPALTLTPDSRKRLVRQEAVRIADFYPAGLKAGSFVSVDAPFAADAWRNENGAFTAGPPCTRSADCKDIKAQPIAPGRTHFTERVLAVDEAAGIVWLRMSWARGQGTKLVVWEAFKVYGGQIHAVEAFMKLMPLEAGSGWD
jgi:hypothetical protein